MNQIKLSESVLRSIFTSLIFVLFLFPISRGVAQPVNNDPCSPISLSCNSFNTASTIGSTHSSLPTFGCGSNGGDVFFSISAQANVPYELIVNGDNFDAVITIYSGDCSDYTYLTCIDNEFTDGGEEVFEFTYESTTELLIKIEDFNSNNGDFQISLNSLSGNNDCSCASFISSGITFTENTTGATSSGIITCLTLTPGEDLFYWFGASQGYEYTVSVQGDNLDGVLSAFTGTCSEITQVLDCSDNIGNGVEEIITFSVPPNATGNDTPVYIQVYDYYTDPGEEFTIELTKYPLFNDCANALELECNHTRFQATGDSEVSGLELCYTYGSQEDLFFKFDADPENEYTVHVQGDEFDGVLSVFTGPCSDPTEIIGCSDNIGNGIEEQVTFIPLIAETVYIQVFDYYTDPSEVFEITLTCAPSNDNCENAKPVSCGNSYDESLLGATASLLSTPSCFEVDDNYGRDLYYSIQAIPGTLYDISISATSYDRSLTAYSGSCSTSLSELDCSFNIEYGNSENVSFSVPSPQEILIRVYHDSQYGNPFTLEVTCEALNYTCENADPIEIEPFGSCPANAISANNTSSTGSYDSSCEEQNSNTLFYSFNSGANTIASLTIDAGSIISHVDIVEVIEGTLCTGTSIHCGFYEELIVLDLTPHTDYTLIFSVNSVWGIPGSFEFCLNGIGLNCPEIDQAIGSACDDGIAETEKDVVTENCICLGEPNIPTSFIVSAEWNSNCGQRDLVFDLYDYATGIHVYGDNHIMDTDGTLIVPVDFLGTYDIHLKVDGYLQKAVYNYSMSAGVNIIDIGALVSGDINNDNGINISDFSLLNISFGSSDGDPNYNYLADMNCDGNVNIIDVSILNIGFGMVGDLP